MHRSKPDTIILTPSLPLPVKDLSKDRELSSSTFVHAHIIPWWVERVGRHRILQSPIMHPFPHKNTQGGKDTLRDDKKAMELWKYNKMGQEIITCFQGSSHYLRNKGERKEVSQKLWQYSSPRFSFFYFYYFYFLFFIILFLIACTQLLSKTMYSFRSYAFYPHILWISPIPICMLLCYSHSHIWRCSPPEHSTFTS